MTPAPVASVAWRKAYDSRSQLPLDTLPEVRPDWDTLLAGGFGFLWCGHSSLILRIDSLTVLLDPVLSSTASPGHGWCHGSNPPFVTAIEFPRIDAASSPTTTTTTSTEPSSAIWRRTGNSLHRPDSSGRPTAGLGVAADRITERGWDESTHLGTVGLTPTEARHASRRGAFDGSSTLWAHGR